MSIGIIILAAGNSERLGRPKQLEKFNGRTTLLESTLMSALGAKANYVLLVTGAYHKQLKKSIQKFDLDCIYHSNWKLGMGSSIKTGLERARLRNPHLKAAIIAVCDQPFLTPDVFNHLIDQYSTAKADIVTCCYQGVHGVPALFDRKVFEALDAIPDKNGAQKLVKSWDGIVSKISFESGIHDIDTEKDLKKAWKILATKSPFWHKKTRTERAQVHP